MRMRWRGGLVAHPSSSERCGARRWGARGVTPVENAVHNSVPVAFWALYIGHHALVVRCALPLSLTQSSGSAVGSPWARGL